MLLLLGVFLHRLDTCIRLAPKSTFVLFSLFDGDAKFSPHGWNFWISHEISLWLLGGCF